MHLCGRSFLLGLLSLTPAIAQFLTFTPNLTTIASPVDPSITISYRVPTGACKTVFDTQQQYTGWVNVPGDYPSNIFFWFFGSRSASEDLTIWINGGPGASSMLGLFTENGPCEVVEKGLNQLETVSRQWGWDRASNLLFIDQPNQVGFSYDVPTNLSLDLVTGNIDSPPQIRPNSRPADTFLNGTFSSQSPYTTVNTTDTAATVIWKALQGFIGTFSELNPSINNSLDVNLFAESYGGKYGPAFASKWEDMNLQRQNGTIPNTTTVDIRLKSLGIVNGCIDDLVQSPYYVKMATDNSYGLDAVNSVRAASMNASFYRQDGCADKIKQCRTAAKVQDPTNSGSVAEVNTICVDANSFCSTNVMLPYRESGRSDYDIAAFRPDSWPPSTYLEYVNSDKFQMAIGASTNYTTTGIAAYNAFLASGDYERGDYISELAGLLNKGIRVGLMYGDRDYICNWYGGEAASLAVAQSAGGKYAQSFSEAGYAPIIVNDSYIGGAVRQLGNLSFSRIYQAGHSAPSYQPETAFQIFARIILGTSVSTGNTVDLSSYNTTGSANATQTAKLPKQAQQTCWLRDMVGTCSEDQQNMILQGQGAIINGALYSASSDWPLASATSTMSSSASESGSVSVTTTTEIATGVFTATATPSSDAIGVRGSQKVMAGVAVGAGLLGVL